MTFLYQDDMSAIEELRRQLHASHERKLSLQTEAEPKLPWEPLNAQKRTIEFIRRQSFNLSINLEDFYDVSNGE